MRLLSVVFTACAVVVTVLADDKVFCTEDGEQVVLDVEDYTCTCAAASSGPTVTQTPSTSSTSSATARSSPTVIINHYEYYQEYNYDYNHDQHDQNHYHGDFHTHEHPAATTITETVTVTEPAIAATTGLPSSPTASPARTHGEHEGWVIVGILAAALITFLVGLRVLRSYNVL